MTTIKRLAQREKEVLFARVNAWERGRSMIWVWERVRICSPWCVWREKQFLVLKSLTRNPFIPITNTQMDVRDRFQTFSQDRPLFPERLGLGIRNRRHGGFHLVRETQRHGQWRLYKDLQVGEGHRVSAMGDMRIVANVVREGDMLRDMFEQRK